MSKVELVTMTGRESAIRSLFWDTVTIGQPLPFKLSCADQYERLGLNWYLQNGAGDGAVAVVDNEVVGYCLVCVDPASFHRAQRRHFIGLAVSVALALITGRTNKESRHFYWYRLRDSLAITKTRQALPKNVHMHVHLNVGSKFHDGSVSLKLRDHADHACLMHGATAYFGEMNAIGGRRIVGLHRVGGQIVDDSPNHTFSWLTGKEVHRLTLVRNLSESTQVAA